ncbi:MAG TPA: dihydrodipicolinate reductase [Candidatus Binatia bacterium]|nr:dihydrodipicolinate reductase [Candidatus Binatia bacterium]
MEKPPIPVAVVGLGPIGLRICRRILARPELLQLVAVTDKAPEIGGRRLADLLPEASASELVINREYPAAPRAGGVLVQTTTSHLTDSHQQLRDFVELGWNVVSTCEELSEPLSVDPKTAADLDALARGKAVTILGTGVNPGFMMDTLPLALTTLCAQVTAVRVHRVVDTNLRREPLQRKAGVGMSADEFRALAAAGRIGHVGLLQSLHLIARGLGWALDSTEVRLEPVIAERETASGIGPVPAGSVIGQAQVATGHVGAREVIRFELEMVAGRPGTDEVWITGDPSFHEEIHGGINGDIGTEAVVTNLIGPVAEARPGLLTMADLVPLGCRAGLGGMPATHQG